MPQVTAKLETCSLDFFKPDERELARHDDPEENRRRGEDMLKNGQLQAVGATEDGRMIFGHGRLLSARLVGIKMLEVKIYPASISDTQFYLIRASENLQRKDLTGFQKYMLCAELMSGNATWQMKDLAEALHLDPSMVTRLLSPSKCIPAAQEALKAGKIGISTCYALSKCGSADEQASMLTAALNGASRDQIEQRGRKARKGNGQPSVRVSKVKIPLASGNTVNVSGDGLDMDGLVECLSETLKQARKANESGYDVSTFSSMMKDLASK